MSFKIAMIEPVGGHGGMDYYDFGLCAGLKGAGVDVVLHTCDETAQPQDTGFAVRHSYKRIYGHDPAWKRGLRYVRGSLAALFSAVREGRRVCHFHLFHVGILEAMNVLLAKLSGRSVVITAHDVESFVESLEMPLLNRWVYRQADRVIVHNRASRRELMERMGVGHEKVFVIPHGNYLHALRTMPEQREARRRLGVAEDPLLLLFFGQIKDVKGVDLLLEAMPEVLQRFPQTVLLVAGKPWKSDFLKYETLIETLGICEQCVTHIRYIPDEEVPLYYAASDLVVLPYRRIYQSGALLMAMSYGRPVLVSDLPGMTEIVADNENGFVFRQGDREDLVSKLRTILSNKVLRDICGQKGLEYVQSNYDWPRIGKLTAQLYGKF